MAGAQPRLRIDPGASGALSATRLDPAPGGSGRTELQFEQPLLFLSGQALGEHLHFSAALSLDKLATPRGVMSFGASGGGFYDRQHPHDYIHEAVVSLVGDIGGASSRRGRISLSGGKGIVPFGSDPPHMRPALHAPMNHHWSQIMERPLVIMGVQMNRVGVEVAFFEGSDGSESHVATSPDTTDHGHGGGSIHPDPPVQMGFGQSRSVRINWRPWNTIQLRGSLGTIKAPSHHAGSGEVTKMWNVSGTFDRESATGRATLLAEVGKAVTGSEYWTGLAESQWSWRQNRVYYRVERTDRPEGPRAADPFRSSLEPTDPARVGASRWFVHTVGYGFRSTYGIVALEPVVELAVASASTIDAGAVNVKRLYGQTTMWSGVLALKLSIGAHHSMGQYGALSPAGHHAAHRQ